MDLLQIQLALETAKAGFEFGSKTMEFLATKQGQAVVEQSLKDRANWDKSWSDFGKNIQNAFAALGTAIEHLGKPEAEK